MKKSFFIMLWILLGTLGFLFPVVNARILIGETQHDYSYWNFYCNGICAFISWWSKAPTSKKDCVNFCLDNVWKCDSICVFKIWWIGTGNKKRCIEECLFEKILYKKKTYSYRTYEKSYKSFYPSPTRTYRTTNYLHKFRNRSTSYTNYKGTAARRVKNGAFYYRRKNFFPEEK